MLIAKEKTLRYYNEPTVSLFNSGDRVDGVLYTPEKLFMTLREFFGAKSGADLSYYLQCCSSALNQYRRPISPALLLRCHDRTGISVDELRMLAGLKAPVDRYDESKYI